MLYVIVVEKIFGPGPDGYYGVHKVPDNAFELERLLMDIPEELTPIVLTEDDARKPVYELSMLFKR